MSLRSGTGLGQKVLLFLALANLPSQVFASPPGLITALAAADRIILGLPEPLPQRDQLHAQSAGRRYAYCPLPGVDTLPLPLPPEHFADVPSKTWLGIEVYAPGFRRISFGLKMGPCPTLIATLKQAARHYTTLHQHLDRLAPISPQRYAGTAMFVAFPRLSRFIAS